MSNIKSVRFILVLIIASLVACQGDSGKDGSESGGLNNESDAAFIKADSLNGPPSFGSLSGDTLNIGGKFVLFFGPVEKADNSQKTTPAELQVFKATSAAIIDTLSSNPEIKVVYSTAGIFRIFTHNGSVMLITKSALNVETGLLISDGNQPPTIKKGVISSEEYIKLIRNYFFLN